ncbi:MAS protein, partial [Centropus bengalensis]|nr:MAS protein [Centropus bengalensis]
RSTFLPAMERNDPACWSQPGGVEHNRTWRHSLQEDDDWNWPGCDGGHLSKVPVTLLICLCGLVGNGAVLWFLGSCVHKNPATIYALNLAVAHITFLLSIAVALVPFYVPGSLCHRLGSWGVTTLLNVTILFSFTASAYLLTAFSAVMSLPVPTTSCCPCHRSWHFPVLLCALLWAFAFLLTLTLYFSPSGLIVFLPSYLLSVLILIILALTLPARVLCRSWPYPPRKLCVVVLLAATFPFFTADFGFWLVLRPFDFSVFAFNASLPLACVNGSINPVVYFLAGSCSKKFTLSIQAAFQRALGDGTEPQHSGGAPRENPVET